MSYSKNKNGHRNFVRCEYESYLNISILCCFLFLIQKYFSQSALNSMPRKSDVSFALQSEVQYYI
jgi:hypothetical protein